MKSKNKSLNARLRFLKEGGRMLFFRNDYGQGCIPEILELLNTTNLESKPGYGLDSYCEQAKILIQSQMPDTPVDIHFISGGTLTNLTIVKSILRPYEAVIACDTGHIATHETGSIEATGHKVIEVNNCVGKITPAAIEKAFEDHMLTYEHMVYPKMVYISNPTEFGTVYTREELEDLRKICDKLDLYLMMDGARLATALTSGVDYTLNDLAKWMDVFYIGGTKNGALMGEAIVFSNLDLSKNFRFVMKQDGAMMSKGWLLGLQFIGLFQDDAFFRVARHANEMAQRIQDYAHELGYPFLMKSTTNQIFLNVTLEQYEYLSKYIDFEIWSKQDDFLSVRFVTSWHTSKEDVDAVCALLHAAKEL